MDDRAVRRQRARVGADRGERVAGARWRSSGVVDGRHVGTRVVPGRRVFSCVLRDDARAAAEPESDYGKGSAHSGVRNRARARFIPWDAEIAIKVLRPLANVGGEQQSGLAFMEMFCNEPGCDCRRPFTQV
jgi:hypothetical protein